MSIYPSIHPSIQPSIHSNPTGRVPSPETLISSNIEKKNLQSSWNPTVHYRVHSNPQINPIPTQISPAHALSSYFLTTRLNIIRTSRSRLSKRSSSFRFDNQNHCTHFSRFLSHTCHTHHPSYPL